MNCCSTARWLIIPFLLAGSICQVVAADIPLPRRPINTTKLEQMRSGTASAAKEEDLLQSLAMWLAHRLVHPPFNGKEPDMKTMDDLQTLLDEVERWCNWPVPRQPPNDLQMEYAKAFGKVLAFEIMDVYQKTDKPLEKVNAARMLAIVGKLPCEELADTYLKIIRDNAFKAEIKFFAFQGLRNLLAIPDPVYPTKHFIKSNAKLAEISNELEKYITFKCAPGLSADEARVIQYIRREAVRALAQMKVSVVRQQQEALAKPIMTLLRVATNDKYVNPNEVALAGYGYHMLERLEAVIGICSMLPDKHVNMDLVTYLINDALIDMDSFQARERIEFQKDPRNKPLVPWKIIGIRLADAMNALKKNMSIMPPPTRNPRVPVDWVDAVLKKCVEPLEKEGVLAQPDYRPFSIWKSDPTRKPKATKVIEEDDTTSIGIN